MGRLPEYGFDELYIHMNTAPGWLVHTKPYFRLPICCGCGKRARYFHEACRSTYCWNCGPHKHQCEMHRIIESTLAAR
jgi:hypothetical protein